MTKLLLGIAIIAFTSFCGYVFTKKYRKRKRFFAEMKEFNERFISEISYYRRPIAEFFAAYTYKGEFNEFFKSYFQSVKNDDGRVYKIRELEQLDFLNAEEKNVVEDYFQMLGKGDSASQKAYFSAMKERIQKLYSEAETDYKKYGDLYVKLGFLCGLFILIIII